jgi:hypothetical protein
MVHRATSVTARNAFPMGRDFREVWLECVTGLKGVVQLTVLEARGPCQEEIRRRQGNWMNEFY